VVQERAEDPKAPEASALYLSLRPVTIGSGRVGHKLAKRQKNITISVESGGCRIPLFNLKNQFKSIIY